MVAIKYKFTARLSGDMATQEPRRPAWDAPFDAGREDTTTEELISRARETENFSISVQNLGFGYVGHGSFGGDFETTTDPEEIDLGDSYSNTRTLVREAGKAIKTAAGRDGATALFPAEAPTVREPRTGGHGDTYNFIEFDCYIDEVPLTTHLRDELIECLATFDEREVVHVEVERSEYSTADLFRAAYPWLAHLASIQTDGESEGFEIPTAVEKTELFAAPVEATDHYRVTTRVHYKARDRDEAFNHNQTVPRNYAHGRVEGAAAPDVVSKEIAFTGRGFPDDITEGAKVELTYRDADADTKTTLRGEVLTTIENRDDADRVIIKTPERETLEVQHTGVTKRTSDDDGRPTVEHLGTHPRLRVFSVEFPDE